MSVMVVSAIAIALAPAAAASADEASVCSAATIDVASLEHWNRAECATRGARLALPDGRMADIPDPGWIVTASYVTARGHRPAPDLTIARSLTGAVGVVIGEHGAPDSYELGETSVRAWIERSRADSTVAAPFSTNPKCDNYSYSIGAPRWIGAFQWYRKSGISIPYSSLAGGINAMASGTGQCANLANGASASYQGTTSSSPTISSSGTCQTTDFVNTVGDGTLPAGILASTCTYKTQYEISYADVKFNTALYSWYTGSSVTGCSGSNYDAQGVMAHEAGHVFGMGHVSNSTLQVMKTSSDKCETSQRLLGSGDLAGMKALYP